MVTGGAHSSRGLPLPWEWAPPHRFSCTVSPQSPFPDVPGHLAVASPNPTHALLSLLLSASSSGPWGRSRSSRCSGQTWGRGGAPVTQEMLSAQPAAPMRVHCHRFPLAALSSPSLVLALSLCPHPWGPSTPRSDVLLSPPRRESHILLRVSWAPTVPAPAWPLGQPPSHAPHPTPSSPPQRRHRDATRLPHGTLASDTPAAALIPRSPCGTWLGRDGGTGGWTGRCVSERVEGCMDKWMGG